MLAEAQGSTVLATRCQVLRPRPRTTSPRTFYYGPFYFSLNPTNVSAKGVGGPGLTSPLPAVAVGPTIPWESIWYNPSS